MDKGIPYPYDLTNAEIIDQFEKLKILKFNTNRPIPKTRMGNNIIKSYFDREQVKMKRRGRSYLDIWKNEKEQIKRAYKSLEYPMPYTPLLLRRAMEHINYASIFKPSVASYLIQKFKPKVAVFSPQMGWGEIMLGTIANDIDFIGIDSNKDMKPIYNKMIKTLNPYTNSSIKLIFKDSNKVDYKPLKYDMVIVSPPYEEVEKYANQPEYEDFYNDFLIPSIKKTYEGLLKGGIMAYNIPIYVYKRIVKDFKKADGKIEYPIQEIRRGYNTYKEYIYLFKK